MLITYFTLKMLILLNFESVSILSFQLRLNFNLFERNEVRLALVQSMMECKLELKEILTLVPSISKFKNRLWIIRKIPIIVQMIYDISSNKYISVSIYEKSNKRWFSTLLVKGYELLYKWKITCKRLCKYFLTWMLK